MTVREKAELIVKDIPAYSNLFNILGIIGKKCPMDTPMIMHRMTHTDKYF